MPGCSSKSLDVWHKTKLDEEFSTKKTKSVSDFADYLALEERLFDEMDRKIYAKTKRGAEYQLNRFSADSAADPRNDNPNWNRSFEFSQNNPKGGVLLLHGMSDSPYSLHALGQILQQQGYWVVGLRLPGHGTIPSGLRWINRKDLSAAVRLSMQHLQQQVSNQPLHIIGYSIGATLGLEYTLDALEANNRQATDLTVPTSLILISPALGVDAAAGLAGTVNWLGFKYVNVQPEFDPYKYNSFATNAAQISHKITRSVAKRLKARVKNKSEFLFPPTLVFKSTVDATVANGTVVDRLLQHLSPNRHEMVLFDINRLAELHSGILISNPAPITNRVLDDDTLPVTVTFVSNISKQSTEVASWRKKPFSKQVENPQPLQLEWPAGVISLSHVALPFAPTDPLYGQRPSDNKDFLFLGQMSLQGEKGLLKIPADWAFRIRYNPFFEYLETRTLDWIENAEKGLTVKPMLLMDN